MEESEELQSLSLLELYNNKLLYTKVLSLMQQHKSYDYIVSFLKSKGYKVSKGSLSNFKSKMTESEETGTPIEELLDKRKKKSVSQVDKSRISGYTGEDEEDTTMVDDFVSSGLVKPAKVYSTQQVLEDVIQKGVATLQNTSVVDLPVLLKATEMLDRYHSNTTKGLTSEALKQYQLINQAQTMAAQQAFIQYVPEDKREEALEAMEKATDDILQSIGVSEDGKKLLEELRRADMPVD
jgi:hypothetical protein